MPFCSIPLGNFCKVRVVLIIEHWTILYSPSVLDMICYCYLINLEHIQFKAHVPGVSMKCLWSRF